MKYSRSRIIALTILSITMAIALFCTGYVIDLRSFSSHAAESNSTVSSVSSFDDLYRRISIDGSGSILLGKDTKLTLTEERYEHGVLTEFLNASTKRSFLELQNTKRLEGYPYPIFTNDEMGRIKNGYGKFIELPVILLDPDHYDDIVLFELTNLPSSLIITRDDEELVRKDETGENGIVNVDGTLPMDKIYAGEKKYKYLQREENVYDDDGNLVLILSFNTVNNPDGSEGYVVKVKNKVGQPFYNQSGQLIEYLENDITTSLYSDSQELLYKVIRKGDKISVCNADSTLIKEITNEKQLIRQDIGAVAVNGNGLRGMFRKEGLYEITLTQNVQTNNNTITKLDINFAFVIVNKNHYMDFPRFNAEHRVGNSEIYNYAYEGDFPVVDYSSKWFDVQVNGVIPGKDLDKDPEGDSHSLEFYNMGEYRMVSSLRYSSVYLDTYGSSYEGRGVVDGCIDLKRIMPYSSVLNILGFQMFFGGQNSNQDLASLQKEFGICTDISDKVRELNMSATDAGLIYSSMRVSEALKYSNQLANFLMEKNVEPVSTNFPPVKIKGNVPYLTGAGTNGEKAVVLSTVAYRSLYGENAGIWESSILEVGAPFEKVGQYLITVYFKVNNEIYQQNFFFEISNSAHITFKNGDDIIYLSDLVKLNSKELSGKSIKINYNKDSELGRFETQPVITLETAALGNNDFSEPELLQSGEFQLVPGQYRLNVAYGAYGNSKAVYHIIVDDSDATGIKAHTKAGRKQYKGLGIVGAGKVNLSWDFKQSGIDFVNVDCEFYEMQLKSGVDYNADRNYNNFDSSKINNIYSGYNFVDTPWKANSGYEPIKTEDGWKLNETFENPGLYIFTFTDAVGHETEYILVIDGSKPTFVQNIKPIISANAVELGPKGVIVGFGKKKLVTGSILSNEKIKKVFQDADLLVEDTLGSGTGLFLGIGFDKVEYSLNGKDYTSVSQYYINKGYNNLLNEGTYYFRVTDILGNSSEYYIIVTKDRFFGTVYAETICPAYIDEDSGMLKTKTTLNTSLVSANGGMTNRLFTTFSFNQSNDLNLYVNKIYLNFYPFTYELGSANYPFAEVSQDMVFKYQNGNDKLIYSFDPIDSGKEIRLALFDKNTITPNGMYVITAEYSVEDTYALKGRNYYFIVDNQKMLHYEPGKYESVLEVTFANKTADAEYFAENHNQINSNCVAGVRGFESKYSYGHKGIGYNIQIDADGMDSKLKGNKPLEFHSLTPRFSYIHNNEIFELGSGSGDWEIGKGALPTDSSEYKLIIADDARNIACQLVNGNVTEIKDVSEPTSANYDYLVLNLEIGRGVSAKIQIDDNKVINCSDMEFDGSGYTYVVDPRTLKDLKLSFESDSQSMYVDVDVAATVSTWNAVGFDENIQFNTPDPIDNEYVFDIMSSYLTGRSIEDGSSLSVSIIPTQGDETKYTILFDRAAPSFNLERIIQEDNLASVLREIPTGYIYGVDGDFVFENLNGANHYLETKTISYREVDNKGDGTQSAVTFKLYSGADGEARIPFSQIVGLRDNEMKYYMITETDYAGNIQEYIIQLQGKKYAKGINFIGAIDNGNSQVQAGIEMYVSKYSVHQFFLSNDSFKFECGDDYYLALGSTASWRIDKEEVSDAPNTEDRLIEVLNHWVDVATEKGVKCTFTLFDRIGDKEIYNFYNIRDDAPKIELDCYQSSVSESDVTLSVTNLQNLPKILFDEGLLSLYKMTIRIAGSDIKNVYDFKIYGTQIQGYAKQDLIIEVTDPFGRVSITEYHQQKESSISFITYGNTVTQNGVIYIGDERGVQFSYLREAYNVLFYNAATGEVLTDLQPSFISNDTKTYTYTFVPTKGISSVEQYRIVATGRASGARLFDKTFVFDTRLPNVDWKNASEQKIQVQNQTLVSEVTLDITNSLVPTTFPVTISYTRTYNQQVERVTLKAGTQKHTFKLAGKYKVTLRNVVWAEKTYEFEIAETSDDIVLVYDDEKKLEPCATNYKFKYNKNNPEEYIMIPQYIFTVGAGDLANYKSHGLEVKVGQSDRVLVGNTDKNTVFYASDAATLIWKIADEMGNNPIYIATTGVAKGSLNESTSPITLKLSADPSHVSFNGGIEINPLTTTYHEIDDAFMKAHDNKIEISLSSAVPYYIVEGNTIVVKCYFNGQLVKTLQGNSPDQVYVINRYDAGFYEFEVHDMVGNYLRFGDPNETNKDSINYQQKRYTLWVRTKPTVLINDKMPINGMIYNDRVEIKLVDYGNNFLRKRFANEIEADENYLSKYYCISEIRVAYTGSNGREETVITEQKPSYVWTETGTYQIKVTYRIDDSSLNNVYSEFTFQIIPSYTVRETLSMSIYPDVQVASVKRNGSIIHDFDNIKVNEYMEFDADINPGNYVVAFKTFNHILQEFVFHDVMFNIQHKTNSASDYFILSGSSGAGITGSVILKYNPYWLFLAQGDVTIYVYKNEVEQLNLTIDSSILESENYNLQELFTASDAGMYSVIVRDVDGDPVFMDSWTVNAKQSTFGYVILVVVLCIFGIGLLIFVRMRNKMSTK